MSRIADDANVALYVLSARDEFPDESDQFVTLAASVILIAEQLGQALDLVERLMIRVAQLESDASDRALIVRSGETS